MLWCVNDPAISTHLLAYILYIFDIIYLQLGQRKEGLWINGVFLKTLAVNYTALHGTIWISSFWWSKGHASHWCNGSLCSSSEVIYILLHTQVLTIWKVECRWTLWKTWAVNSNNKDTIPSHFRASIIVTKDGKPKSRPTSSTLFSFLSWGTYQKGYSKPVVKIKDSQWDKIISSAQALSMVLFD